MDLEYAIPTHSSLLILWSQGQRKPLYLTPSPSFALVGFNRVATSPFHPTESEWMCLRVAAASAWSEKQNGWECIVRLSFSRFAAAVSLHKILNCFHHIKAVLSYCWHMAWKAASGLFWRGGNWTQRLFEVGRVSFWSWIYQWQYREKKAKALLLQPVRFWKLPMEVRGERRSSWNLYVGVKWCKTSNIDHHLSLPLFLAGKKRAKHGPRFTPGITLHLGTQSQVDRGELRHTKCSYYLMF